MSQIKIFGIDKKLIPIREKLSSVIHSCVVDALGIPKDKRVHRSMLMKKENFFMPRGLFLIKKPYWSIKISESLFQIACFGCQLTAEQVLIANLLMGCSSQN